MTFDPILRYVGRSGFSHPLAHWKDPEVLTTDLFAYFTPGFPPATMPL